MNDSNVALAIGLLTELLKQAATISALVRQAHAEKRELTAAELETAMQPDDTARVALVAAIAKAHAEGR